LDDYPTYEIFLTYDTEIVGKRDRINDFRPGDEVRVWIEEKSKLKKLLEKSLLIFMGIIHPLQECIS
jgi:ribosomal protein L19